MQFIELFELALKHATHPDESLYPDESKIPLQGGCFICYPSDGEYIRFITPKGYEILYWTSIEWQEEPTDCMSAILGLASTLSSLSPEEVEQLDYQISQSL